MPPASALAPFLGAALAMLLIPGPVVLYIITRSVERGRTEALVSIAGIGCASMVHAAAAVFGIAGLLAASPAAFHALQYAGAAWLVWLGIGAFRARTDDRAVATGRQTSLRGVFMEGFTVNILNPKAPLFFLAFLPQFVDPTRGAVSTQVAWLGGAFAVLGMTTDTLWAMAAHAAGRYLERHEGFLRNRHYVSGATLCALGLAAVFVAMHS